MDTDRFHHAITLRDSGQARAALAELEALSRSTEDLEEKASLLLNEARCYRLLGELPKAKERLSLALKVAPRTQTLLYVWEEDAVLHWQAGEREKALNILERLQADYCRLLLGPEHGDLRARLQSSRGMLLAELGRYQQAVPLLQESLDSNPAVIDKDRVLYDLGLSYLQLSRYAEAERMLAHLLSKGAPPDLAPGSHLYLGEAYFQQGVYAKAMMEFEWCLAHASENWIPRAYIYKWLATTARRLRMTDEAKRYEEAAKEA
jgi:tetratricopeptide (TPR) repeat protein